MCLHQDDNESENDMTTAALATQILGTGVEVHMNSKHGTWYTNVQGYETRVRRLASAIRQNDVKSSVAELQREMRAQLVAESVRWNLKYGMAVNEV